MSAGERTRPTKAELERHATAKPRTQKIPGYFTDAGEFRRGPFYTAHLGDRCVSIQQSSYCRDGGCYATRKDALDAAKRCQELARQWLAAGNYQKDGR